jgi:hypothetical protein
LFMNKFCLFRLKYICKKEGFKTSSIALSALADYTGTFCLLHLSQKYAYYLCITACPFFATTMAE